MSARRAGFSKFKRGERKAVSFREDALVKRSQLNDDGFPLVIEPDLEGVSLLSWGAAHRDEIRKDLLARGAVLFRGFAVSSPSEFRDIASAMTGELLDYTERAAPRHQVDEKVFTSTEYPAGEWIPMHHEMSYSHNWPTQLLFFCDQPPGGGGRTPITDARKILDLIDPEVKKEFLAKKVMYVRNYGEGVDLAWREAFQTSEREEVEEYCRRAGMEVEWREGDRLRTRSVRQVLATHPKTGDTVWFNHAHMFHQSNMPAAVLESLLTEFAPDELPRNSFFGDGSPMDAGMLADIRQLYLDRSVRFEWRQGDILLLDNFLAAHAREPFEGERRILVAMSELYTHTDG